jgi:hypothetical protein
LKHFIQISRLCGKNSESDHFFENKEESRFNFLQIKGKPVQTNKTSHQLEGLKNRKKPKEISKEPYLKDIAT